MTELEKVRNLIDDHISIGLTNEQSTGGLQLFQLNSRNVWDLTITDKNGATVDPANYELIATSGQVKGTFEPGELVFEYKHAAFTDEEIQAYLDEFGSTTKAAIACVRILLASASKRFDYKAGIKDIKASQVFDNLKELLGTLTEQVDSEENASIARLVTREHPAYAVDLKNYNPDVSRKDS